jgi:hypothetical protein
MPLLLAIRSNKNPEKIWSGRNGKGNARGKIKRMQKSGSTTFSAQIREWQEAPAPPPILHM